MLHWNNTSVTSSFLPCLRKLYSALSWHYILTLWRSKRSGPQCRLEYRERHVWGHLARSPSSHGAKVGALWVGWGTTAPYSKDGWWGGNCITAKRVGELSRVWAPLRQKMGKGLKRVVVKTVIQGRGFHVCMNWKGLNGVNKAKMRGVEVML